MYNYDSALNKDSVIVNLLVLDDYPEINEIKEGILEASQKFRFSFAPIAIEELENVNNETYSHSLLLIVSNKPFTEKNADLILSMTQKYSVCSVAFSYSSAAEMLSYHDVIQRYKALSKDKVNFLRPLRVKDGDYRVTVEKIVDNSICDSVRIKYIPKRLDADLVLPDEVKEFFLEASRLYTEFKLYHRSASDGYFACRTKSGDGFYITATKTYKNELDLDRISYVSHYDEENNEITYYGKYLPSSDAVEAAILLQKQPDIITVVHTHSSDRFTRNPDFQHKVLVPISSYGEAALGYLLHEALQKETDGFVIMEDHGEIFCNDALSISDALLNQLSIQHTEETNDKQPETLYA